MIFLQNMMEVGSGIENIMTEGRLDLLVDRKENDISAKITPAGKSSFK